MMMKSTDECFLYSYLIIMSHKQCEILERGTKKFYGWVRMGDNATISLLRSTIMSNVSCPYPPDHSPITLD